MPIFTLLIHMYTRLILGSRKTFNASLSYIGGLPPPPSSSFSLMWSKNCQECFDVDKIHLSPVL